MMYAKIAVAGATAAAIIGVGTAALATSGPSATAGSGSSSGSSAPSSQNGTKTGQGKAAKAAKAAKGDRHEARKRLRMALRRGVHGEIVTKGKDGFVTHSAIRGTVTSVSSTSLTVKAADGFTQTYTLGKQTKVRERTAGQKKPGKGTVADLKSGDSVGVIGAAPEKAGATPAAQLVVDGLTK